MIDTTLLNVAFALHYAKRFEEARVAYQRLLDSQPTPEQAAVARQQMDNLRDYAFSADGTVPDYAARPRNP